MPFEYRFDLVAGDHAPVTIEFVHDATESVTIGDMMSLTSGESQLATTNDSTLIGVLAGAGKNDVDLDSQGVIAAVNSTTRLKIYVSPFAVYGGADNNARNAGASLDFGGATGAYVLATDSNSDVFVVKTKVANSDETLFIVTPAECWIPIQ